MVDPLYKQDLMLIKNAFEKKAQEQSSEGAMLIPIAESVSMARQTHESTVALVSRYPSSRYKDKSAANNSKSFLSDLQDECIPCLDRIKSIADLDLSLEQFKILSAFNIRALETFMRMFRSLSGSNEIERHLCQAYMALRSQCIPDIARMLAALSFLLADLRSFNLKGLKDQLVGIALEIISSIVLGLTVNLDMFQQLITGTLRCVANDIRQQLYKLQPILSRDGFEAFAQLLPLQSTIPTNIPRVGVSGQIVGIQEIPLPISRADAAANKAREWFPEDFDYVQNVEKQIGKIDKLASKIDELPSKFKPIAQVSEQIVSMIETVTSRVDQKLEDATSELLKLLKLSDGNLKAQVELLNQIQLIMSVINILKTIMKTGGDYNPCGPEAGRAFFTRIKIPGNDILIIRDDSDPEDPTNIEINIIPRTIEVNNPVVEEIFKENGISIIGGEGATKVVEAFPIEINLSRCLDGA